MIVIQGHITIDTFALRVPGGSNVGQNGIPINSIAHQESSSHSSHQDLQDNAWSPLLHPCGERSDGFQDSTVGWMPQSQF